MNLSNLLRTVSLGALALATVAAPAARAQEQLPAIDVGAAAPTGGEAVSHPVSNGTDIGPGNNGQICANGVCNDPTSYAAPIESLGTKVNTPVMETPLATKMVTHQMLEDQQVITLDQALRNVSGVYISGGGQTSALGPFSSLVIRGFSTSAYYRDGIRVDNFGGNYTGVGNVEFANVESVEVLKGPAAILYGAVEPGGIVNLDMKQPLDHPAYSVQQQIGSYASYRTTLDATGPLSQNKDVLYRFTMSYENDGSFRQYDYNRNLMFNPVVKWNIDANTWIKVSNQYQENDLNQDFYTIPYYNNVIPLWLGRGFNFGGSSPLRQQQDFAEVTVHHDFNKDWSVQQTAFMQTMHVNFQSSGVTGISDCITPGGLCYGAPGNVLLEYTGYPTDQRQEEYATVLDVTGHFNTGELGHTLLLGSDYYRYNYRGIHQSPSANGTLSLFGAPAQLPTAPGPLYPAYASDQQADNVGAYVQDQIKLPYGVNVLAGARYQYINSRTGATDPTNFCGPFAGPNFSGYGIPCNFDTETIRAQSVDQRVTPRAAVLWHPTEWVSFYGNYVESYSPNYNGFLVLGSNSPTPPSAGQQEEAGVKFQFLDKKLQITADYYHLVKTNIPIGIPNNYTYELLVGQGRSQGPELDIQGELMPGWTINLAYANTDAITTKSIPSIANYAPPIGAPIPYVPRNQGTLATNYEFKSGMLKGLKLGARYDYTGYLPFFNYANDGTYIYGQPTPSYGLVGLLASYSFDYNNMKVIAQINVDNLFDRSYFTAGGLGPIPFDTQNPSVPTATLVPGWSVNNYNANVIGAPRTIRGSIKVAF